MPRVSLQSVAAALEISAMTVSRALRGQPGVSDSLRKRIRATAVRLGYQPDPTLNRLMLHLRRERSRGVRAALCAVTDIPASLEPDYCARLHRRAALRARELGFAFSILRASPETGGWPALVRILAARGVEGVVFLPMVAPTALESAPWDAFSVVAATSSVSVPLVHRVTPDHAANARLLVARLAALGHRRLGFVGTTTHGQRTCDAFPSAVAWHHARLGLRCTPLIHAPDATPDVAGWILRQKPDVIILGRPADLPRYQAECLRAFRAASRSPAWALAGPLPSVPGLPALDERHDLVGAAAIDTLAGLVARGERGTPSLATTVTIPGDWSGPSATLS